MGGLKRRVVLVYARANEPALKVHREILLRTLQFSKPVIAKWQVTQEVVGGNDAIKNVVTAMLLKECPALIVKSRKQVGICVREPGSSDVKVMWRDDGDIEV